MKKKGLGVEDTTSKITIQNINLARGNEIKPWTEKIYWNS